MTTKTNYTFAIPNSDGTSSTTYVDMDDMFVSADTFVEKGLYAWGFNATGQLGDGTIINKSSPIQVGTLTNWKQVSGGSTLSGNHTAAIKTDGTLWAWGFNASGQLGDGTIVPKSSPVQIGSLTSWKQVSSFSPYTAAIKTDGTLWAWGLNTSGQLGDGTINNKSSPVQVGALTDWKQVSCGYNFSAAIKTDGTLWTWGTGTSGQLGDGTVVTKSSPVQIGALTNWKQVSGGGALTIAGHTAAITTDGKLYAWGLNTSGNLGDDTIVRKSSPVQIGSLTNWKQVSAISSHTAAISSGDY